MLKGGNLLDIVFQVSTRASIDLDFSIEGEFQELDAIQAECFSVLEHKVRRRGLQRH